MCRVLFIYKNEQWLFIKLTILSFITMYKSLLLFITLILFNLSDIQSQSRFQKIYIASADDYGNAMCKSNDGGYLIAGSTASYGNGTEILFMKLDSIGNIIWTKTLGGTGNDQIVRIRQTSDGGYIASGNTSSYGSNMDIIIVKITSTGALEWVRTLDCGLWENGIDIGQTSDGGYIVGCGGGLTASDQKLAIAKLTSTGAVTWFKRFNWSTATGTGIKQTSDGGYIASGGNSTDICLVKFDGSGNIQWTKSYAGSGNEVSYEVVITSDGGYLISGDTWSYGVGNQNIWLIKTNSTGTILWNKTYGQSGKMIRNGGTYINQDGSYIISGVEYTTGTTDNCFLFKVSTTGNLVWVRSYGGSGLDMISKVVQSNDKGFAAIGYSNSFGVGNHDLYFIKTDSNGFSNLNNCNISSPTWGTTTPSISPGSPTLTPTNMTTWGSPSATIVNRTFVVKVLCDKPVARFSSNLKKICQGKTVNFYDSSLNNPNSWLWTFTGGVPSTSSAQNPANIKYNLPGTYDVRLLATNSNGTDTDIVYGYIKVFPNPDAQFSINDSIQCLSGNKFIFTNTSTITSGKYDNYWKFGNGDASRLRNPTYSYTNFNTYTVKLILISDSGCTDSIAKKVYIYPAIKADFTINDSIQCVKNNNFSFTNKTIVTPGTFVSNWIFGDGNTSKSINSNHQYLNPGSFTVKLLSVSDFGCRDSISKMVFIDPSPKALFSLNDSDQCLKGNKFIFTNLSSIPSGKYKTFWDFGDGDTSTKLSPTHIYLSGGHFIVKLKLISDKFCTDSILKNIFVIANSAKPIITTNGPVCAGDTLMISSDSLYGSTYQWFGPNGFNSTKKDILIKNSTLKDSGIFRVVRIRNGCPGDTAFITVIVKPVIDTSVLKIGNNSPLCEGDTLKLKSKNIPGLIYNWTGSNVFMSGIFNPIRSNIKVLDSGSYFLITDLNGCKSKALKTRVIVKPTPIVSPFNNGPLCVGDTLKLSSNTISGGFYMWTSANGFFSTLQNPFKYPVSLFDSGNYNLVIDLNGCKSITRFTHLSVYTKPDSPVVNGNFILCEGEDLKFITSNIVGGIFNWTGPAGFTSKTQNPKITKVSVKQTGLYQVKVTVNNCTSAAGRIVVQVNPAPMIILGNDSAICEGELIILDAGNYTSYLWQDSSKGRHYTVTMPGKYWVNVSNLFGCSKTDSINIKRNCPSTIFIPNVFTPNNDGINDSFTVTGENILEFEILIYNRWGEEMFRSNDIMKSWDGMYLGAKCSEGVYYWMVNYGSYYNSSYKRRTLVGTLTLLR